MRVYKKTEDLDNSFLSCLFRGVIKFVVLILYLLKQWIVT